MKTLVKILFLLVNLNWVGFAQTYCTPTSSCNSGDRLDTLIINNIKYFTNPLCAPSGFNYFPNSNYRFKRGTSYNFTLKLQQTSYSEGIAVFLDINGDGDFTDAGEKIFNPPTTFQGINGPVNFMATIPLNTILGKIRMRVRVIYNNSAIAPCTSYTYGETEDYEVTILPSEFVTKDELVIEQTTITNDTLFEAYKSIITQNNAKVISNQKKVRLTTEQKIELKPGTLIERGSTFVGYISIPEVEESSAGILSIKDSIQYKFNPLTTQLKFQLTGVNFSNLLKDFSLLLNDKEFVLTNQNTVLSTTLITVNMTFLSGSNTIRFRGKDALGKNIFEEYEIWTGTGSLQVNVVDHNNNPVNNAQITITIGENNNVSKSLTSANGQVSFQNLPLRTILLNGKLGFTYNSLAVPIYGANTVSLKLIPFNTPSIIDNNDFSKNLDGWNIGTAPVQIVPHNEDLGFNILTSADPNDFDMQINTYGQGAQSVSRTFNIKPGTKKVDIRYRFITSEVPGGYFGTKYNDYYAIRLRSILSGNAMEINNSQNVNSDENNMNGLGIAAFNYSTGATTWKTVTLPVSGNGDIVQVEATVANVADGLFDSQVEIDVVGEGKLAIEKITLYDKNTTNSVYNKLEYLSLDSYNHNNNKIFVWAKDITIKGANDDALKNLTLQVLINGDVVATGVLTAEGRTALLKSFGNSEKIEFKNYVKLFEIPGIHVSDVNTSLILKLVAESQLGERMNFEYKTTPAIQLLNFFPEDNRGRFSGRDGAKGGDGWGRPAVITWINSLPAHWKLNDISEMNGHNFQPDHTSSHRKGFSMDLRFDDYIELDANEKKILITKESTAKELVDFIKTTNGLSNVVEAYVEFDETSPFAEYIKNTKINATDFASSKIRKVAPHKDHFHFEVKFNAAQLTTAAFIAKREKLSEQISASKADYAKKDKFASISVLEHQSIQNFIINSKQKGEHIIEFYDFEGTKHFEVKTNKLTESNIVSVNKSKFIRKGAYLIKVKTPDGDELLSSFTAF